MPKLIRRLRYLLRLPNAEAELREELEFHRAERQRQLERDGLPTTEAEDRSRRALGNTTLAREDARAVWIWPWLESVWQDIVYAIRGLRREPGIRLALGARPAQVVGTLLATNSGALLAGLGMGIAGALAATRIIRSLLNGLSPFDPIAYVSVAVVLTFIAIAATIVPARRATRIDPIAALRCE